MRNSTVKATISPGHEYVQARAIQLQAYFSGVAFRSHLSSAHDGKFDLKCQACREMFKKTRVEPQ